MNERLSERLLRLEEKVEGQEKELASYRSWKNAQKTIVFTVLKKGVELIVYGAIGFGVHHLFWK